MIFGNGIDIIEVERIENSLKNNRFRDKIFTKKEIAYCKSKKKSVESYAARFAAKEAFFKALGTGWRSGFSFLEIEICNNEMGKPILKIAGKIKYYLEDKGKFRFHLSLSHLKEFAIAQVIIEKI